MSNYNSTNTIVLATYEAGGGNTRMLLLHICENGRHQYVIGSYFTESIEYIEPSSIHPEGVIVDHAGTCFDVASGHIVGQANNSLSYQDTEYYEAALADAKRKGKTVHYSWDWGNYFDDVFSESGNGLLSAVDYWKREVLGAE